MKRAPTANSPADSSARKARPPAAGAGWADFVKKCAAASAAVALQMGCPGSQVRPESGECPDEAIKAMTEELNLDLGAEGHSANIQLDERKDGWMGDACEFADGPVRGKVKGGYEPKHPLGANFPEGTRLDGQVWTTPDSVLVRYTRATLPNGRTYPVCISVGEHGPQKAWEGSKPGAVKLGCTDIGFFVKRWP